MSVKSLVDKVVKGAIATAIAATETAEEVAESVSENAIRAALTRPKRSRETIYDQSRELSSFRGQSRPPPSKKQKSGFSLSNFLYKSFKNDSSGLPGQEGYEYGDGFRNYLKKYAILKHGGPLVSGTSYLADQLVRLPVDIVQKIMLLIRDTYTWTYRFKWTPLNLHRVRSTWLDTVFEDVNQRHAYGYNRLDNGRYSRFDLVVDPPTPAEQRADARERWPQYSTVYNNLRRLHNFRAPLPLYQVVGDSHRNALAWAHF